MSENNIKFPKVKKIFSRNIYVGKTAFLNWRTIKDDDIHNLKVLADGYISSALILTEQCLNDNFDKKADELIFPILFNVNHGIELYLKSLVWMLNKLSNSKYRIEGSHDIKQILSTLKSRIETHEGKTQLADFNKETKDLQRYIDELYEIIGTNKQKNNLDFSRYPIDKNYLPHFYVDTFKNIVVDLENFIKRFAKIKSSLDNVFSYYFYQKLNQEW